MEAALQALVIAAATAAGGRAHWGMRPQGGALPAVTLRRVSGGPGYRMSGPDGHAEARVQVDCYAATMAAALALRDAIEAGVGGHRGGVFYGIFADSLTETNLAGPADEDRLARVAMDLIVHYRRD